MTTSETPIPVQEYPDVFQYVTIPMGVTNTTYVVLYAETEVVIDSVIFVNQAADTDDTLALGFATTAGQSDPDNVLDGVALSVGRGANILTGSMLTNIVPAGRFLEARLADNGLGDAIGALQVKFRTLRK